MNKKGYRTLPSINRQSDAENYSSNWMNEFAKSLEKVSVQPRKEDSLYDQIMSIMNGNKPKYSSVEDAVKDMQERSGLTAYKNKENIEALAKKQAQSMAEKKPNGVKLFDSVPQIQNTVDNYVKDTKGNLPIPAIIEKLKSIHKNDVDNDAVWDDNNFLAYVNDKCIEIKKMYPDVGMTNNMNLGKMDHFNDDDIDPSNNDVLISLSPANVK